MNHPLFDRYAELLTGYCTEVRPGDVVSLNVDAAALPMARALARATLRAGGRPLLRLSYDAYVQDVLELAPDDYFDEEPELELHEIRHTDAWIRVRAPENTRALQSADKGRYARLLKRNRPVQNLRVRDTRWCGTLFPTAAGAQDAGMSLDEYERFVFGAMYLFDDDPPARWRELHARQEELIARLREADEVRIVAPGTDLTLSVKGRTWVNSAGHRNMPSGEVFTGPIESSAEGTVTYTVPSAVNGVEVAGVRLRFEGGKVVEASADKGEDLLLAQLDTDEGARFLGEIGIGTNYQIQRPTMSTLFDEKIGGTVHLAVGQSYQQTGGVNESAIHWDMICDLRRGGAIYLDGEPFQENGEFRA